MNSIGFALAVLVDALACIAAYFFLGGFIWGAGYEPTPKKDIDTAAKLLNLKQGMTVYDLGSGTGQVVIHLAKKYMVKCVGIEVDPVKAWISRALISRQPGLAKMIEIKRNDLFSVDISEADAVYVFLSGGTSIMKRLETKLSSELREGARVASYIHLFRDWTPCSSAGKVRVYLVPKDKHCERENSHDKEEPTQEGSTFGGRM